ncbi:MAG: SusC/RagA family TonB-linked outer membrane protein [Bacteroidota bacterium]
MKKIIPIGLLFGLLLSSAAWAQDRTVSGTVTNGEDGQPLPGVTVRVQGTSSGVTTDLDGKYNVQVGEEAVLTFSFVGFTAQTVEVGARSVVDVTLNPDLRELGEVVVTAFGMERDEKRLGYSITQLDASAVEVKEPNVVNSLSGKVAGVTVNRTAGGPGGSTRVLIRGNNKLTGNNQPLYVVDGVPINNANLGPAIRWGGYDYGDGIGDIVSDDIESISILKGPNGAALYGSRGQNGVIMITTKRGNRKGGVGIEYNGSFTWENPLVLPAFQNEYGHGTGGEAPDTQAGVLALAQDGNSSASWGAPLNGQSVVHWNGETKPYSAQPNNIADFYQTGHTYTNSLAVSGGNDRADVRLGVTRMDNAGIVPTSTFDRTSISLRANVDVTDRLSADVKANYVRTNAHNRPAMAEIMENVGHGLMWMPRSVNIDDLSNYETGTGEHQNYTTGIFKMNPYWSINNNTNDDTKNRLLGYASLQYDFTDWLNLRVISGIDTYNSDRIRRVAVGTPYRPSGQFSRDTYAVQESNNMALLNFDKSFGDLSVSATLGGNIRYEEQKSINIVGSDLTEAGWYHVNNAGSVQTTEGLFRKQVNSVFAMASLAYQNFIFLDLTGRREESSSIPGQAYFYPSATLSTAFTELLDLDPKGLTFGKLRASYAVVGSDTDPYQDRLYYSYFGSHLGQPLAAPGNIGFQYVPSTIFPAEGLSPESTQALEVGADFRFWNDRIGFDVTYYDITTNNQILPATVSSTSGGTGVLVASGSMNNRGIEMALRFNVLESDNLRWETGFNWARNVNTVLALREGLDQFLLTNDRGIAIEARPDLAYGNIVGLDFERDDQGRILFEEVNGNAVPVAAAETSVMGNINPDWTGGWLNTVYFGGFRLSALIDVKMGGDLYSITNRYSHASGNHINTLEGRDGVGMGYNSGQGLEVNGVLGDGTAVTDVDPEAYWNAVVARNISNPFVYDASYVKLRELSLGYSLPEGLMAQTPLSGASISLVGRNLAFLYNSVPGLDPESTYNVGNGQGIESGSIPSTQSVGVSVQVKF